GGSRLPNQSIDAVPLLFFGGNELAQLRVLPHVVPRRRPTGERFDPQPHLAQWRHTAWSQSERVDDITGTGFQLRLESYVLAPSPSRTRRNNGEPGGLTPQRPVARTALAH